MENKGAVGRINVRDVEIAFLTRDDNDGVTYESPIHIPGTMQIQLAPRVASDVIHGDGNARYHVVKVGGYDVTFDHNRIPSPIMARMRGQRYSADGKTINSHVNDVPADFAMGFTIDLTGGEVEVTWLVKCSVTPPNKNTQQTTENMNHSPDSVTIFAMPLEYNGYYEHIGDTSDKESGFTMADAAAFFNTVPILPPRSYNDSAQGAAGVLAASTGKGK